VVQELYPLRCAARVLPTLQKADHSSSPAEFQSAGLLLSTVASRPALERLAAVPAGPIATPRVPLPTDEDAADILVTIEQSDNLRVAGSLGGGRGAHTGAGQVATPGALGTNVGKNSEATPAIGSGPSPGARATGEEASSEVLGPGAASWVAALAQRAERQMGPRAKAGPVGLATGLGTADRIGGRQPSEAEKERKSYV